MTTYKTVEEYAAHIQRMTTKIMGAAAAGRSERAGELAAQLCTEAANIKHQKKMQQEESAGNYDLAALRVDVTTASNSETPFEHED